MGIKRLSNCDAKDVTDLLCNLKNAIDYFSLLSSDIIRVIGLNMSPSEINLVSRSAKRFNDIFCNYKKNNENFKRVGSFWRAKVQRDFGQAVLEKPPTIKWWDYYLLCKDHPEVGKYLSESGFSTAQLFFLCRLLSRSTINRQELISEDKMKEISMMYYNLLDRYIERHYENSHRFNSDGYDRDTNEIKHLMAENNSKYRSTFFCHERSFIIFMSKIGSIYRTNVRGKYIRHAGAARAFKEISAMLLELRTKLIEYLKPIILKIQKRSNFEIDYDDGCEFLTNNESKINRINIRRVTFKMYGYNRYDAKALKAVILFKFGKTTADVEPITGSADIIYP